MKKMISMLLCCGLKTYLFAQPTISRVEYFFDSDPGLGKATSISIANSTDIANQQTAISTNDLAKGIHTLHFRSQNASGIWSVTNSVIFLKGNNTIPNIVRAEYFWDIDPGFGNATAIPVNTATDVNFSSVTINAQALPEGFHILLIRTQDANGSWSVTNSAAVLQTGVSSAIAGAEYFIDVDPGFGKATPLAINPADSLPNFAVPVNITGLTAGKHILQWRSQNALGKWSVTNSSEFTVSAAGTAPFINVNSSTDKQMCAFESFSLAFDAHGVFNSSNIFTAQLSDANGNFTSPINIGSITTNNSSILKATLPSHLPDGNNYKIRVVSSNVAATGIASDTLYQLRDRPDLGPDTLAAIVCLGETINLNSFYNTSGLTSTWNTANTTSAPVGNYRLIAVNLSGCRDTAMAIVKQKAAIWTGALSTNWHTPANWANNRVPDNKAHVIIPAGTPNRCVISETDGIAASIQVKNGAIFNIINNKKITVLANCSQLPSE